MSDFIRQFMLLGTEVGRETEVADTAVEVPTPPGLLSVSYQTPVPQRLPNQFVLVNSFAVKLFFYSTSNLCPQLAYPAMQHLNSPSFFLHLLAKGL